MTYAMTRAQYCDEVAEQAGQFADTLGKARPEALKDRVPTCPEWTLRDLVLHQGAMYRWVAELVRGGTGEEVPQAQVPEIGGPAEDDGSPEALHRWFVVGAEQVAAELRAAEEQAPVWTPFGVRTPMAWARRVALETMIHRADLCRTVEFPYGTLPPALAADGIDELLEMLGSAAAFAFRPELKELGERAGATLHLHATDVPAGALPEPGAEWLIELAADGIPWRRGHARADVALRAPLTELLLVFYRRQSPDHPEVEVLGDRELLDFWREKAQFG